MSDPIEQFSVDMQAHGLQPDRIDFTGNSFYRFPTNGNKTDKPGYYSLTDDGGYAFGCFGDWSRDLHVPWSSKNTRTMTPGERAAHDRIVKEQRRKAAQEREKSYREAAERARNELAGMSGNIVSHEYLFHKKVHAVDGLMVDATGALVVPISGPDGSVMSYQRIFRTDSGFDKRFMPGGRTKGGWFKIAGNDEAVCICEGLATGISIHEATGYTVIVAFSGGNLVHVARQAKSRNIVVCGDNDASKPDNPGLKYAQAAAEAIGARLAIPVMPEGAVGTDFNDLAAAAGLEAVRAVIEKPNQEKPKRGLQLIRAGELIGRVQDVPWLIKNLIQRKALISLFGDSGSLKTFLAISWAVAISARADWFGHEIKESGPVIYFTGEGAAGIPKRLKAAAEGAGVNLDDIPLFFSTAPAQILHEGSAREVAARIGEITAEHGEPVAVFFDTLARNFGPGDENSTKDMSRFISMLDQYVNAAIILIHHTGLTSKERSRGAYALPAALDQEYRMQKNADGTVELHNTKNKDAELWTKAMKFQPQSVTVGHNDQGEPITSLYLTHVGEVERRMKPISEKMVDAIEILKKMYSDYSDILASQGREKTGAKVRKSDWQKQCVDTGIYTKSGFYDAIKIMEKRGLIRTDEYYVYLGN